MGQHVLCSVLRACMCVCVCVCLHVSACIFERDGACYADVDENSQTRSRNREKHMHTCVSMHISFKLTGVCVMAVVCRILFITDVLHAFVFLSNAESDSDNVLT